MKNKVIKKDDKRKRRRPNRVRIPISLPSIAETMNSVDQRDTLKDNAMLLINRAIQLALDVESPNVPILIKLLDKLVPTLTSSQVEAKIKSSNFPDIPDETMEGVVAEYAKLKVSQSTGGEE